MTDGVAGVTGREIDAATLPDLEPDDENPLAGQGSSVVVDIGGDVGALVVTTPESMRGVEVEIRGIGHDGHRLLREFDVDPGASDGGPGADVGHGHGHGHAHDDGPEPTMDSDGHPLPHVAVVVRPTPAAHHVASLVYRQLHEGRYELFLKGTGQVELVVEVRGGEVTEAVWPS